MDLTKTLQTLSAVAALVAIAKKASKDGKITPEEWLEILGAGVVPLLRLHGVYVPANSFNPQALSASDQVAAAIALHGFLGTAPPNIPDRGGESYR